MARTTIVATTTSMAGVLLPAPAAVDAVNGNQFVNTGREHIEVTNGSGASITVTFTPNGTYSVGSIHYSIAPVVRTLAAGETRAYGPFDTGLFNDATHNTYVDWSSGTTVTARVISLGTG